MRQLANMCQFSGLPSGRLSEWVSPTLVGAGEVHGVNTASRRSGSCYSEDSCPGSGCDNRRVVLPPSGGLYLSTLGPSQRGVGRASPNSDVGLLGGAGCS